MSPFRRSAIIATVAPVGVAAVAILSGAWTNLLGITGDGPNMGSADRGTSSQDQGTAENQLPEQDHTDPRNLSIDEPTAGGACFTDGDGKEIQAISGSAVRHRLNDVTGIGLDQNVVITDAETCITTRADAAKTMNASGVDRSDRTPVVYMAFRISGLDPAGKAALKNAVDAGKMTALVDSDDKGPRANNDRALRGTLKHTPTGEVILVTSAMQFRQGIEPGDVKVGVSVDGIGGSGSMSATDVVKITQDHMPTFDGSQSPKVAPINYTSSFNGRALSLTV